MGEILSPCDIGWSEKHANERSYIVLKNVSKNLSYIRCILYISATNLSGNYTEQWYMFSECVKIDLPFKYWFCRCLNTKTDYILLFQFVIVSAYLVFCHIGTQPLHLWRTFQFSWSLQTLPDLIPLINITTLCFPANLHLPVHTTSSSVKLCGFSSAVKQRDSICWFANLKKQQQQCWNILKQYVDLRKKVCWFDLRKILKSNFT